MTEQRTGQSVTEDILDTFLKKLRSDREIPPEYIEMLSSWEVLKNHTKIAMILKSMEVKNEAS